MGQGRCSCSGLIGMMVWIGGSIGKMPFLSTIIALALSLHWVLSNLGPLNILIPSSRGLEIVGALNHLTLWGSESLSNCLQSRLKLWLSMKEHRSSCRRRNTEPGATA
jgi:hypothetical protein